jgi:hypothetical protein
MPKDVAKIGGSHLEIEAVLSAVGDHHPIGMTGVLDDIRVEPLGQVLKRQGI